MKRYLPGALLFLATVGLCVAPYTGDTLVYAGDILAERNGQAVFRFNPLWEFGHLFWRPLGALLAPVLLATIPDSVAWTPLLKVAWGLIALNYAAGLLISASVYRMALQYSGSWKASAFLTLVMVWANGFLIYTQAGTSYVFALLFLVVALHLQLVDRRSVLCDILSGASLALAALFWFPFILVFPAVTAARWIIEGMSVRDGIRNSFRIGLSAAIVVGIGMAAGIVMSGVRSPADLHDWYRSSQHGWDQNRRLLRAISGVPRLLIDLSSDGILLKRYTFRDPYNPVSAWDLVRLSAWKLVVFYLFLLIGLIQAWVWRPARPMLSLFLLAGVPVLLFSVFLFEPSSPERFLPVLPFWVLLWAAAWPARWPGARILRLGFVALGAAVILINIPKFISSGLSVEARTVQKLSALEQVASPGDILITVTFSEPQVTLIEQRPFHAFNRDRKIITRQLVEVANKDAHLWRQSFAALALQHWDRHRIWLSKSVRSRSPHPEINWVEGDNPKVPWSGFPGLFSSLEYDAETADENGYMRLAWTQHNREELERLLGQK